MRTCVSTNIIYFFCCICTVKWCQVPEIFQAPNHPFPWPLPRYGKPIWRKATEHAGVVHLGFFRVDNSEATEKCQVLAAYLQKWHINHMNIPWITVLWTNLNYGGGFCPSRVALESDPAPCSGTTPLPRLIHVPTFKYNGRAGGKCGKIMENRWNIVHQGQNRIWWF